MKFSFSIFPFMNLAFSIICKNSSRSPRSEDFFFMFSSKSFFFFFYILYLNPWSVFNFCVEYEVLGQCLFFFICVYPVAPEALVEKTFNCSIDLLLYLCKNQWGILAWISFWVACFVPLIYMSVSLPILHCLVYCSYREF